MRRLQTQYEVRHGPCRCHLGHGGRTAPHGGPRSAKSARQREESAAADVARLSQRESDLSSQLADADAAQ
jgi:hypothetical protein